MSGADDEERFPTNWRDDAPSTASGAPVWMPAQQPSELADEDTHVWLADVDGLRPRLSQFSGLLSEDETSRAARFLREDDRLRFVLARGLTRYLLGAYLAIQPATLRFRVGPHGKPALAWPASHIMFNASHARNHVLIAFARHREVGVDIEFIRDQLDDHALAARFFSPQEQTALSSLPAEERTLAFYVCWTRKEAYIKATGEGLNTPLASFTVPLAPIPPQRPFQLEDSPPAHASTWTLHDLPPIPGYAAALVTAQTAHGATSVSCWRFH